MSTVSDPLSIGSSLIDFDLPATDGKSYSPQDFSQSDVVVVFFSSNSCPYVTQSDENTRAIAVEYLDRGVTFVAINSNSSEVEPRDSFEHMVVRMAEQNFPWVYLRDEDQSVARTFGAISTPHFFVFGRDRELRYSGRAIDNPRNPSQATTHELRDVLKALLSGQEIGVEVTKPVGCSVEWHTQTGQEGMPAPACDR